MALSSHFSRRLTAIVVLSAVGVAAGVIWLRARLPEPGSPVYEQYVEEFGMGVAALDSDVLKVAEENLTNAIALVPQEPAAWANRGLLLVRSERLDEAAPDLEEARRLAPDNPQIQRLLGLLAKSLGQFDAAADHLRKALERDPANMVDLYQLAQVIVQANPEESDAEHQRIAEMMLEAQPDNLFALQDRLQVAVRRGDREAARDSVERLSRLAPGWSSDVRDALAQVAATLSGPPDPDELSLTITFANMLRGEPSFNRIANAVNPTDIWVVSSMQTFLRLTPPPHTPAAADHRLAFTSEPAPGAPAGRWDVALPAWLTKEGGPTLFVANSQEMRQAGGESALPSMPVLRDGVLALDWNNDFRADLLVAGSAGLRFYEQQEDGSFTDVTEKTGLPTDVLQGDYYGAWAADTDLDGDLDIVVARTAGSPLLLRNNFDGTLLAQPIFDSVDGARAFAWADLDDDGAPDAALLDAQGVLHVFANERSGKFDEWLVKPPGDRYLALVVADANDDGVLDLVALRSDGALVRISDRDKRGSWDTEEIARWDQFPEEMRLGAVRLLAADLDNNGVTDLVVSGPEASRVWLGESGGKYAALEASLPGRLFAAADLDGDGQIDLLGLDAQGQAVRLLGKGQKNYHWQAIRPIGLPASDNRINSFSIGGEIEVRAGTFVVKQPVAVPVVHFGLGDRQHVDVVRLKFPNGTTQIEFKPAPDKIVVAEQRLKGSCPFLFAWNGERFVFVSDFLWSSPLGMYISAQDKGGFLQTTDWVKISGNQLAPRDGSYELRINANLWETHFFDQLALVAVDHPPGTEMFVDERFALEPAEPALHLTEPPRPVARAWDHHGKDVTELVSAIDGVYLDHCGRGAYQGVTHDHWVEIDLGDDAPSDGPLWLLARGWVHPTDSSINFALEQGKHDRPHALVLEVPDGQGGWKVARDKLGFPAGKNKTMTIRLDGLEGPGVSRRVRLRTNMEIFWDALQYARGEDDGLAVKHQLAADTAELRHRGILEMTQANASSPELPHYDRIIATRQYWRDLIGYHTRYGDIRELVEQGDDRYAILCAGDEVVLRFKAPAEPPTGWKRDFVWIADGWVKDGDLNTRFGKTVLPLPAHDMASYDVPPGRLQDDPVYRRHPRDWEVYHTRYVTPRDYERGLRGFQAPREVSPRGNP